MSKRYERAIKSGKGLCIAAGEVLIAYFANVSHRIGHALIFFISAVMISFGSFRRVGGDTL